jgi:protein SCO1/2
MTKRSSYILFILLVFAFPITAYTIFTFHENRAKLPVYGTTEHHIQDFRLQNQEGETIRLSKWKNKIVVVDFFFTHCPTICPKMTASLKEVIEKFQNDAGIILSSFTVDPQRDSVAQLKKYAERFSINTDKWDLITGEKKDIYKLARNSFMIVATDGDGGPGDFIHSDKFVLIDKQARIRGYYDGTDSKEIKQLILDIKKLKNE